MKEIIKNAYKVKEGLDFFNSCDNKELILTLYKELDCVYDILEYLDIVNHYNVDRFKIEKYFEVTRDRYDLIVWVGKNTYKKINIFAIISELFEVFEN